MGFFKTRNIIPGKTSGGLQTIGNYTIIVIRTSPSTAHSNNPTGTKPKACRICWFCSELHNTKERTDKYKETSKRLRRLS